MEAKKFQLRRIAAPTALILASIVVLTSLLNGLVDWSRIGYVEQFASFFPLYFSEPRVTEIVNLSIFFASSVVFWHLLIFFLPRALRFYELQSVITEAKVVSSIDYFWILAAAFAAIFSVSALTVEASSEELKRLHFQEESLTRVGQDDLQKTKGFCKENPHLFSNDYSTKDRVTAIYYPQLCSFIDREDQISGLVYEYDFLDLCRDAGFIYEGGEGGLGPIAEPEKVAEEDRKSIEAVSSTCIYARLLRKERNERQRMEEEVASFDEGILTQSSLWFLIVLFLAALRLTKTTKDVFRSKT